jgi:30S ribosomal protein S31
MGKGDQRSRRGKIWRGTFGKRRPKKSNKVNAKPVGAGEPATTNKKEAEPST